MLLRILANNDRKMEWSRFKPIQVVNPRLLELETSERILEEFFFARPYDVDDMIQRRLEEKSWQGEEELRSREFCMVSS